MAKQLPNNEPPKDIHDFVNILCEVYARFGISVVKFNYDRAPSAPYGYLDVDLVDNHTHYRTVARFSAMQFLHMGRLEIADYVASLISPRYSGYSTYSTSTYSTGTTTAGISYIQSRLYQPAPLSLPLEDLGLAIEPIVGYRDWKLRFGYYILLQSRNTILWPPRKELVALCKGSEMDHEAPDENCGKECGIYAFDHTNTVPADSHVWGEVYLWGRILITSKGRSGFRAEYAYPKQLYMKQNSRLERRLPYIKEALEENYGVPVEIVKEGGS